MIFQICGR